ncbi:hypothetical protein SAMN05428997_14612 [Bosea sp. CRIB-10]|uniref:hypothetical protein n=1 Tax=Bosea sp. CRIB-10 TaxID=378404 RepID=UPI0008EAB88D|nr:hypothetical protein [Bosea sp. CRIB-10]SFD72629.1 hypothetical protein SAMN05428997_14612 [Bosea sp. CRIB-10]
MQAKPLSLDLRDIAQLLREHWRRSVDLPVDNCLRLAELVSLAARKADELQACAGDVEELEDELLLVAGAAEPEPAPSYQAALKAQQAELQRQLDGGGPVHVSRPGLAALAMPIGETNVVSFPRAPHPSLDGGGDAA